MNENISRTIKKFKFLENKRYTELYVYNRNFPNMVYRRKKPNLLWSGNNILLEWPQTQLSW